jgi:signal transduction histidine kinase
MSSTHPIKPEQPAASGSESVEEQVLRLRRMENLGVLATRVAHDLNNMLSPMLLAAPMLRNAVSDPAAQRLLETLEATVVRATALVRQILDYANDSPGQAQLVPLPELLGEIALFATETFPKAIRVERSIMPELWPVRANLSQIHQVLLNLCVNARDAMPRGGALRLTAENCRLDQVAAAAIDGGRAGAFVLLRVEDTGCGFAPEVLAKLWQPSVTTKEAGKGRGLGLSTVRGIVKGHGGFVQLQTSPRGSAFRIYLPTAGATEGTANWREFDDQCPVGVAPFRE